MCVEWEGKGRGHIETSHIDGEGLANRSDSLTVLLLFVCPDRVRNPSLGKQPKALRTSRRRLFERGMCCDSHSSCFAPILVD